MIKKSRKPLIISVAILAAALSCYFLIPEFRLWLREAWEILTSGDARRTEQWVSGFGWFGPVMIVIVMVVQMFLIIVPSWLLMIVAIVAYGPIWGSTLVFAGIFAASTVGYLIGRIMGPDATARLIGMKSQRKVTGFLERYGVWAIVITRINPLLSNDAISFMAGLLRMRYRVFILSTMAGIAPLVIVIAWLGEMTDGLQTGLIWLSGASLVGFGLFLWWDKKRGKQHKNKAGRGPGKR